MTTELKRNRRSRLSYFIAMLLVILAGLASRRYPQYQPSFIAEYAGDALYALMVFCGLGLIFPDITTRRLTIAAAIICYAIEVSQLYHAAWIDTIRSYRLGRLVLGTTFVWSDLICYTVGALIGAMVEILLWRRQRAKTIRSSVDSSA